MTLTLDAAIRDTLCICFPKEAAVFCHTRAWHGSSPAFSVLLLDGDRVIAHAGVVDRTVLAGETPVRVAGPQNVCVLPAWRGRGLCDRVMTAVAQEAQKRGFDAGLLFCLPVLERIYARCGWVSLGTRPVLRVEEGREIPIPEKNVAMFLPVKRQDFPPGRIHLRGNDW